MRKRIFYFSSMDFFLGEPFILIYLFPGKWWNFDLSKQGGRGNLVTSKNGNVKEQIFLNGSDNMVKRLKWMSGVAQNWWKHSLFSAADLPQECRTRRSYSLDRIHLYDSYFPFPFQNKYLLLSVPNDFLLRISLRRLFWSEVFVAINLLANDPECNLSRQIKALVTFAYDLLMLKENFWRKKW